jgi:hypothetical protein
VKGERENRLFFVVYVKIWALVLCTKTMSGSVPASVSTDLGKPERNMKTNGNYRGENLDKSNFCGKIGTYPGHRDPSPP